MAQPLAIIKTVIGKGVTQLGKGSKVASKHAPEILMAIGTGGFVTTVVMAAKAAPTIEETYKTATEEARNIETKPKQLMHISAKLAPVCTPSIVMGAVSLGCFFGAHTIQVKRQFALASAYSMLNQTLNTYQDKVIEKFGEEGHDSILGDILADDVETVSNDAVEDISIYEGEGDTLVYDRVTGRYFKSSPEKIREAEGKVAKRLVDELCAPLNYFYEELGLDDYSFIGDAIGWTVDQCQLDVAFRSGLDNRNRPCLVLVYATTILDRNSLRA